MNFNSAFGFLAAKGRKGRKEEIGRDFRPPVSFFAFFAFFCGSITVVSADVAPLVLRWKNGETIAGEIVAASATELKWKSRLFGEPLEMRWSALRRIDALRPALPIADTFGIALRDGSFVHGDLVSLTEKSVTIRSARHGEVVLSRAAVLALRRLRGGDLSYGGPMGDAGWSIAGEKKADGAVPDEAARVGATLKTGPGGALSIPFWNTIAVLDVKLPDQVDVEFRVRSTVRPDFLLSLNGEARKQLRVETWNDDLVLALGDQFKLIRKIAADEREVALRLCWDRKALTCSVFTAEGNPLVEWRTPEDSGTVMPGLVLQNKGRDLSLEMLRVRKWDGKPPAAVDVNSPRVELADGRTIAGRIGESSATTLRVHPRGADKAVDVPVGKVDAVIFTTDAPQVSEQEASLAFADATFLSGKLSSIQDGRATMQLPFQDAPMSAQIDGLRRLRIATPATPNAAPEPLPEAFDRIAIQNSGKKDESEMTLHGRLAGAGDDQPRWLPVGGVKAVALSKEFKGEITRAESADNDAVMMTAPALIYTTGGEVLPGNLRAISRTGVEFESSVVEATGFPAESIHAIQFGSVIQKSMKGFTEPRWKILKGDEKSVRKTDDAVRLEPGTAFGHPSVLQCSEVRFKLAFISGGFSAARLRLFCSGTSREKSSNLVIGRWSNTVRVGFETADDELENATDENTPGNEPLAVRLRFDEKGVEVLINGNAVRRYPLPLEKRAGGGLVIEPLAMFGNEEGAISLSDFSTVALPGRAWLPDVAADAKTQTLTVPRFRKDDPPRHALIGVNGDVLRGEIEAMTANHYGFRSGLENLRVLRERVNAVVWLKKPDDAAQPAAPDKNPVLALLDRPTQGRNSYGSAGLSSLIGALRREAAELKFKLPEMEGNRRASMKFEGQTIKDALGQICAALGLRYRLGSDGTIIVEEAPPLLPGMEDKTYWLKADAFSKGAPAEEILKAKGLALPDGATLSWQPEMRQVTMTNTPENHAKLAAIIESDFGGSMGSPTHWFLLTDGGRIGLRVDRFDKDSVTGRHPIYGRCKLALADIHSVRTSAPEASAAMKSLQDWRLVFAPEPVLPETGGESSAMLGKEAKAFKLPLLDGGDFDFAKEKGKVVVLDFWATWCGPCVKMLPELIEAMSAFPEERVKFVGVNQSEPLDLVKRFLETRGWKLPVAMDIRQEVAKQFEVDGLPYTVIVGADGKVAWVKSGASADGAAEVGAKVQQLLDAPGGAVAP